MLEIDGSYGEGGGQVLRTALSLSMITGRGLRIVNIRARRSRPGLRPQHLTAVRAAAALCQARVSGDTLGSPEITFEPQASCRGGAYRFDVSEATRLGRRAPSGSAGAVTLVLQTVLLPLALANGPSDVTLLGGTTVPMSPPALYVDKVYLPTLFEMGVRAQLSHRLWGFYPEGGGEVGVQIRGDTRLRGHDFSERGDLLWVEGVAFASKLPSHIPQRMVDRARSILSDAGLVVHPQGRGLRLVPEHVRSPGTGTGLFLCARYQGAQAGFLSLGRLGLPAEEVAEIGCRALLETHRTGAAIDPYLGDQLVLPFALAEGSSRATISRVTYHLLTNVWVVRQFGYEHVTLEGELGERGLLESGGAPSFPKVGDFAPPSPGLENAHA
jgi:RNA 3'-terminal phosphate cyclase (ATP)